MSSDFTLFREWLHSGSNLTYGNFVRLKEKEPPEGLTERQLHRNLKLKEFRLSNVPEHIIEQYEIKYAGESSTNLIKRIRNLRAEINFPNTDELTQKRLLLEKTIIGFIVDMRASTNTYAPHT